LFLLQLGFKKNIISMDIQNGAVSLFSTFMRIVFDERKFCGGGLKARLGVLKQRHSIFCDFKNHRWSLMKGRTSMPFVLCTEE
jgi:hypothetical protein